MKKRGLVVGLVCVLVSTSMPVSVVAETLNTIGSESAYEETMNEDLGESSATQESSESAETTTSQSTEEMLGEEGTGTETAEIQESSTSDVESSHQVQSTGIENFITKVPEKVALLKDAPVYVTKEFTNVSRLSETLYEGSVVSVVALDYVEDEPRLQLSSGQFITANKEYVVPITAATEAQYFVDAPNEILATKQLAVYSDVVLNSDSKTAQVHEAGSVISIKGIRFTKEGIPSFKVADGYITADRSMVTSVKDLSNYYTTNPNQVAMLKNDSFYKSVEFNDTTRTTVKLKRGDLITVTGIEYSSSGIPRLVTDKGYLTANKNNVVKVTANLTNYYTTNPQQIAMLKNDSFYKSVEFNDTTRTAVKLKRGDLVTVKGIEYSSSGVPRLVTNKGYLTANKNNVVKVTTNLSNYYTSNPAQVVMLKNDVIYKTVNFSEANRTGKKLAKGSTISVTGIEYSKNGVPRLKVSGGYITANKRIVQKLTANYKNYYFTNPGTVAALKNDSFYSSVTFNESTMKSTKIAKGETINVTGIAYTSSGVPRLVTSKGYLTANKSYVVKINVDPNKYFMQAPKRVRLLKGDSYYSSTSFTAATRGNYIPKGTIVEVEKIEYSSGGTPRLKTPYGYLTANKNYVQQTTSNTQIIMNVPYYNQNAYGYWNGCEEFSLYMALAYLGATKGQSVVQVTEAVPKVPSWGNPAEGFNGNPKDTSGYHTIFPSAFTPYAKYYAPNSRDISGASMSRFKQELLKGNPIVVWGTYPYAAKPKVDGKYYDAVKVTNLHVWLVTGFANGQFHITDPIYGKFWASENTVYESYKPNKMAVVIDK